MFYVVVKTCHLNGGGKHCSGRKPETQSQMKPATIRKLLEDGATHCRRGTQSELHALKLNIEIPSHCTVNIRWIIRTDKYQNYPYVSGTKSYVFFVLLFLIISEYRSYLQSCSVKLVWASVKFLKGSSYQPMVEGFFLALPGFHPWKCWPQSYKGNILNHGVNPQSNK